MVNDERQGPQRKSTRPVSGQAQTPRASTSGVQRQNASGQVPRRAPLAPAPAGRSSAPQRASVLRDYRDNDAPRTATRGGSRNGGSGSGGAGGNGSGNGRGGNGRGKGGPPLDKNGKPIPAWKFWLRRIGVGALATGFAVALIGLLGLTIRYAMLDVPAPSDFALEQASTFYYADGTEIGRLGEAEREIVDATALPAHVSQVFVAAEDRSFYTKPGVDIVGTTRALFRTVILGERQGGSTITQQYVERFYVGETTTSITGKIDEALLALKIDQQQEKDQILSNYMNTIYFGRGAYGIEVAAQKYFGKSAAELTVSEAALLAGLLPAPSSWDPRLNPEQSEFRWNYVLDGMVAIGALTQEERDAQTFPATIEYQNTQLFGGTQGYILQAAISEVESTTGYTRDQIEVMGMKIYTTIIPSTQQSIEAAVAQMPTDAAPNLRVAAATVDPTTGAITGMYGGADYLTIQRNAVTQDVAQAGSTFKPFTLIAALEDGIGLKSVYTGNNNMTIPGFENNVRNFGGVNYGDIDLITATAYSVNTVYAQLNTEVGPSATTDVAIRAGIPEDTLGLEDNASNVLGTASPTALDMARAYATLANGGQAVDTYLVSSVTLSTGQVFYEHQVVPRQVFDADVVADAVYAMQQVVNFRSGSGHYASELGRPIAGKTGTSNENRSAWFVGFTPQQVGVVSMYQVGPNGEAESITPFGGFSEITGGSMPVRIWTWMMGPVLSGYEVVDFPPPAYVGTVASPTPSSSPTPSETAEPSPTASATPSPTPTPTATPTPTPAP